MPRPPRPVPHLPARASLVACAAIALAARLPAQDVSGPEASASVSTADAPDDRIVIEHLGGRIAVAPQEAAWALQDGDPVPVLEAGGESVALDEVLFIRFPRPVRSAGELEVRMRGGDRLRGRIAAEAGDAVPLASDAWGGEPLRLPLERVESLLVPGAFEDPGAREAFVDRVLSGEALGDRLHLASGDTVEGILETLAPDGVTFSNEDLGELVYPWSSVRALRLATLGDDGRPEPRDDLRVVLHLVDGGRLSGRLEGAGAEFRIEHAVAGSLTVASTALAQVDVRGGRSQFLSDLEPAAVEEHLGALLVLEMPYRRDRSVAGTPLRLDGRSYAKGLGVHAYSRLEYDLGGEYERFQCTIGLDDTARPPPGAPPRAGGAVVFRVWLDDRRLVEEALDWRDAPRVLDLEVAGGDRLALEVDFGENDYAVSRDRADWAEARIIRAP